MAKLSPRQVYRLQVQREQVKKAIRGSCLLPRLDCLDLGIEDGHSGALMEEYSDGYIVGVDAYPPVCRDAPTCYDLVVCMDALEFMRRCHSTFDMIVAAELVEHYHKDTGLALLGQIMEKGRAAIVTTPLGFMRQGEIKGNPYQVHKSGWNPEDFSDRGWEVPVVSEEQRLIVATWGI